MKEQIDILVTSKDLKDITSDIVEKVLDSQISNEILQEIPIVKTLVGIKNIYSTYTDRIFIKKAMNVLLELGNVNWKQRVELTHKLDDENSSGTEKILMAIDQFETIKKCKVFGKLCKLKALNKIDADEFSRLTKLIQDAYLDDLELIPYFIETKNEKNSRVYEEEYYPLISLGLIYQVQYEPTPIERVEPQNEYEREEYKGGEMTFDYELSMLGEIFNKHYYDLFPEQKK
jgi:hypothetical protein